jgi:hypothetical protein
MAWLHRDSPLDLHSTDNQILFGHECFKFHFPPSRSDCLEEIALEAFGWRKREVSFFVLISSSFMIHLGEEKSCA